MWKAIKEFFGYYDTPAAKQKSGSGNGGSVTVTVKAPKATATKKAPAKKAVKSTKKNGK